MMDLPMAPREKLPGALLRPSAIAYNRITDGARPETTE
jgi:hypothetical protein